MADFGRIHAFLISNRPGHVLYERFYDRLSELQKGELRTAFSQCSRDVGAMQDQHVGVGNFRRVGGAWEAGSTQGRREPR